MAVRQRMSDGTLRHDYYLSNAWEHTLPVQFVHVIQARHRIEECFQLAKGQAGLPDYEVRTWRGWHHHQALSLIAAWFLTQETREGKKITPALSVPQVRTILAWLLLKKLNCSAPANVRRQVVRRLKRKELARFYHWKQRKRLAPRRFHPRPQADTVKNRLPR